MMDNVLAKFHKAYIVLPDQFSLNHLHYRETTKIGAYKIYNTHDLAQYEIIINEVKVILLGHLVHTQNSELTYQDIFSRLLSNKIDSDEFLEEMSYYNGRYALFIECEEQIYFYNDATSFLSLYYHKNLQIYSSHSELLKQLIETFYNIECEKIASKSNGFLDYSKYKDIYKFNSNTRLNMTQHQIKRIYPITPFKVKTAEEVLNLIDVEIKESVKYLFSLDKKVLCSITAGHDSKVSLSYIKDFVNRVKFFTYTRNIDELENKQVSNIYRIDESIARKIAHNLNLNYKLFNMDQSSITYEMKEKYELYETNHSINLINYYKENHEFQNALHLKSTIFELAKDIVPKSIQTKDSFIPYAKAIKKWAKEFPFEGEEQIEYLTSFIERNELEKAREMGYHPYEILYYESRMNGWHSCIIQESDDYLDVFSLINTRHILFELLQINDSDKSNQSLHKLIVRNNWPILNYFQVNNTETLENKVSYLEQQLTELNGNLKNIIIETKDFYQSDHVNCSKFRSLSNKFSHIDKKKFTLTNKTNNVQKLDIRTFYTNTNGRETIYFDIENHKVDLVDLSINGYELTFNAHESKIISVYASKNFEKSSWINASEFELIEK